MRIAPKLRSRLFSLSAIASLLIFIVLSVFWIRSAATCDVLLLQEEPGDQWCITSEFGVMAFERESADPRTVQLPWVYYATLLPRRSRAWKWAGFDAYAGENWHVRAEKPGTPFRGVAIPHWFLMGIAGVPAYLWMRDVRRRRDRRRRVARGLCARCGYDVRASSGRCPECGEPIERPAGDVLRSDAPVPAG